MESKEPLIIEIAREIGVKGELSVETLLKINNLEEENKRLKSELLSISINDLPDKDREYQEIYDAYYKEVGRLYRSKALSKTNKGYI